MFPQLWPKIFGRMRVDDVSICVKVDDVIIKYGNIMCRKHANNGDQTYHITNKLRELGRLLLHLRTSEEVKCFKDIIQPKLFPTVVKAVTELCSWDEAKKDN